MELTSAPNFRDLGGARAADGRAVRMGFIYRSAALLEPTGGDVDVLAEAGIVLVCDLRSARERDHAPNLWWQARNTETIDLDILSDIRGTDDFWAILRHDPSVTGGRAIMDRIYRALPAAAAPHLGTIFARIAAGDVPMLIHCTAGKDRTGFLSAIILQVLGVPYEAIVADYLASVGRANEQVTNATRRLILENAGPSVSEQAIEALIGVDRAYLDASFTAITTEYGSIDDYVRNAIGLDAAQCAAVRARMLG